jgi:hypothetical protein
MWQTSLCIARAHPQYLVFRNRFGAAAQYGSLEDGTAFPKIAVFLLFKYEFVRNADQFVGPDPDTAFFERFTYCGLLGSLARILTSAWQQQPAGRCDDRDVPCVVA